MGLEDISFLGIILSKVSFMSGEVETLALLMPWSPWFSPQSRGKEKVGAVSSSLALFTSLGKTNPKAPSLALKESLCRRRTAVRKVKEKQERQVLIGMLQGCPRGGSGAWRVRTRRVAFVHAVGKPRLREEAGLLIVRQHIGQSTVATAIIRLDLALLVPVKESLRPVHRSELLTETVCLTGTPPLRTGWGCLSPALIPV